MRNYSLLLLGLFSILVGCTNAEDVRRETSNDERCIVNFQIVKEISRTAIDDNYVTSFVANDLIGVYAIGGAEAVNEKYTVTNDNTLKATGSIKTDGSGKACDFYAYYPYDASNTSGKNIVHKVNADQSTIELFNASDFVTATALNQQIRNNSTVKLEFSHKLAMIELEIELAEGMKSPESVTLTNCKSQINWAYEENTYSTEGDKSKIKMLCRDAKEIKYLALLPEQVIDANTGLFVIDMPDACYTFTTTEKIELKSNYVKKFKIGIGTVVKTSTFSPDISIANWQLDDNVILGEGIEKETNDMIKESFENFKFTTLKNGVTDIVDAGWYVYKPDAGAIAEVVEDPLDSSNHAFKIIRYSYTWNKDMLCYCLKNATSGVYRVKLNVMTYGNKYVTSNPQYYFIAGVAIQTCEETSYNNFEWVNYFPPSASPDNSMNTTSMLVPFISLPSSDKYYTGTVDIDLSQCVPCWNDQRMKKASGATMPTTNAMLNKVFFFFVPEYVSQDYNFYIDNISIQLLEE